MTEPGTCDTFTTVFDPVAEPPRFTYEETPNGWTLRHTRLGHFNGRNMFQTDITIPGVGPINSFVWGSP